MPDRMTRSEVAERAGVEPSTVRYYEQRGLIPRPDRTARGYRIYDEAFIERLRFVKRVQELGFTLEEIKVLLDLERVPTPSAEIKPFVAEKLTDVEAKLRDLERIRATLLRLHDACPGQGASCPILVELHEGQ